MQVNQGIGIEIPAQLGISGTQPPLMDGNLFEGWRLKYEKQDQGTEKLPVITLYRDF